MNLPRSQLKKLQKVYYTVTALRSTSRLISSKTKLEDKNEPYFKNVKLVTPQNLDYFLYNCMKLKFIKGKESKKPGVELLRNIAANYDYWLVRSHQDMLLYYRLQMMQQRLDFLKPIGMDFQQKLRHIQKAPPALLFSFSGSSYESKMVYLRGMVQETAGDFLHLFYPITKKARVTKADLQERVSRIEEELKLKQPAVLRELLNMPCFFMDPSCHNNINHLFIHRHSMPFHFSVDKYTADVLPPVLNLKNANIASSRHCSNKANDEILSELPTYQLKDILDYTYSSSNGKGQPECMSTFLVQAEYDEDKDRTGGQPMKGRRGFNVPPRQY